MTPVSTQTFDRLRFLGPGDSRRRYIVAAVLAILVISLLAIFVVYLTGSPEGRVDYAALKKDSLALYSKGKYKEVISKLETYLKKNKSDVQARNILAAAYSQTGSPAKAYRHYRELLRLSPGDSELLYLLSLTADKLNKRREALAYAQQAAAQRPDKGFFQVHLAKLYAARKKYDEALAVWQSLLAQYPADRFDRGEAYSYMVDIYLAKGDKNAARDTAVKGVSAAPESKRFQEILDKLNKELGP